MNRLPKNRYRASTYAAIDPNSMVPNVLSATTKTLLRKYRPTCAWVQAATYVSKENDFGSANGAPKKISVLVLNDAITTQINGPAVARNQTNNETWARPLNAVNSRRPPGRRPVEGGGATPGGPAGTPVLVVFVVIASPPADQSSTVSRRVTRKVSAAKVRVRKNSTTPSAEA